MLNMNRVNKGEVIVPTAEERDEYLAYNSADIFFSNLENGIKALMVEELSENSILICGAMTSFGKIWLLDFINEFYKKICQKEKTTILLSEVTAEYRRYTGYYIKMPFICTPHLLAKEIIVTGLSIPVSEPMLLLRNEKEYIKESIENLEMRHPNLGNGYAIAWAYYAYKYISVLLNRINPEKVILWNKYYAFHHIFQGICLDWNIKVEYMEFGCLPGTISIESSGQQGESLIASEFKKFRKEPIQPDDYISTKKILTYLKHSGLNRNFQSDKKFCNEMIKSYKIGRQTIVYFGQNDYESGLFPYTVRTKKYHSPSFKSTIEALEYLKLLSIKNEWNLIYKPHPIMHSLGLHSNVSKSSYLMTEIVNVNINSLIDAAGVIITILSQSAYIALIRGKPVVMLGFTQLRGKKCTYEAFKKVNIELCIRRALKYGLTKRQKSNFIKHCSQMLNFCLYDDLSDKEVKIGLNI